MDDNNTILKQLKTGTTEILVLAALSKRDRYGYEITQDVLERSGGYFELKQGFLYPTLSRMEAAELLNGYWKDSKAGGPNRKYYKITRQGRARLKTSVAAWSDFSKKFDKVLGALRA
jgi:DNA-binding PadR family transcriptional regulator